MEEPGVRDLLDAQRHATLDRISGLTVDFEEIVAASVGSNVDDEHDPEGSTVAFERAQVAALLDEARTHLDDLDRALARLAAGTYSMCERCTAPIASERLTARPATRICIRCAAARSPRLRMNTNGPLASDND
jgi:DnaK suppressor protein